MIAPPPMPALIAPSAPSQDGRSHRRGEEIALRLAELQHSLDRAEQERAELLAAAAALRAR